MKAYINSKKMELENIPPVTPDFIGYSSAVEFTDLREFLEDLVLLNEEGNIPLDSYIPFSVGVVIRASETVVVNRENVPTVLSIDFSEFEGEVAYSKLDLVLYNIFDALEKQLNLEKIPFLDIVKNPLYFMGIFITKEAYETVGFKCVFTLVLPPDTMQKVRENRLMTVEKILNLDNLKLDRYSCTLIPHLPLISEEVR